MLSVIVTNRNEPLIGWTVRRAIETADCPIEVIVVDDGSDIKPPEFCHAPLGTRLIPVRPATGLGYCRDAGLRNAIHQPCLVLDAHMNFEEGDHWASRMVAYCQAHPTHIGCAVSVQLDHDAVPLHQQMDMQFRWETGAAVPRAAYYGARIELATDPAPGKLWRPFPCKWHGEYQELIKTGEAGIIQCILGGAYLIDRDWYLDGLRRPWQENRGWGTSEQTIAIPNWLCGGESVLLPIRIGHQYRTGKQALCPWYRPEVKADELLEERIVWNRWKIIEMLPMAEGLRRNMHVLLRQNSPAPRYTAAVAHDHDQTAKYREFLASQRRTMSDYFERWEMQDQVKQLDGGK